MPCLLDTNVAILLRDEDVTVVSKLAEPDGELMISIISRIELEGGAYRTRLEAAHRRVRLDAILEELPVVVFDHEAANAYRRIIEAAAYSRRKILDRTIAAQALVHCATRVTTNAADFRDGPGLEELAW